MRKGKYGARKVALDGYTFDSEAEARRYGWLKILQSQEKITGLRVHPRYEVQPAFIICGEKYRPIVYEADFSYVDEEGSWIVEDVKGAQTSVYKIKKKLFLYNYPEAKFYEIPAKEV